MCNFQNLATHPFLLTGSSTIDKIPADIIKVKVVKDLDISTYMTTEKNTKTYVSTVLCDSTSYSNVIVHDQDVFKNFKANNSLLLQNYAIEDNYSACRRRGGFLNSPISGFFFLFFFRCRK